MKKMDQELHTVIDSQSEVFLISQTLRAQNLFLLTCSLVSDFSNNSVSAQTDSVKDSLE